MQKDMFTSCLQAVGQLFWLRLALGSCMGIVAYIFGENSLYYEVVFMLAGLDITTGLMVGYKNKNIHSKAFFKKAPTMLVYLTLLIAAYHLSRLWPESWLIALQGLVAGYIAIGEFISITENAGNLGVPVPKKLLNALKDFDPIKQPKK